MKIALLLILFGVSGYAAFRTTTTSSSPVSSEEPIAPFDEEEQSCCSPVLSRADFLKNSASLPPQSDIKKP